VLRGDEDSEAQVLCVHNVTAEPQSFRCYQWTAPITRSAAVNDAIEAKRVDWQPEGALMLKPYQSMWLTI
jgi:hypothetical protein